MLGQSEESYLGSAYSTNASGWLVPTWSNVEAGHYIVPNVCYALTAKSLQVAQNALQTLYTDHFFSANIPPAIYYNVANVPASYGGKYFKSLAQNITPPFTPVNHRGKAIPHKRGDKPPPSDYLPPTMGLTLQKI